MAREIQAGYEEIFLLRKSGEAVAQAAQGVVGSPSLEVFKSCVDVALRDVVSGHGVMGWWLNWMTLEVFSNLKVSKIL